MAKRVSKAAEDALAGTFGFDPDESAAHFLVNIPAGVQAPVEISEHLSWDAGRIATSTHFGVERVDGQIRSRIPRPKWNAIAEVVRAEFNARLKTQGKRPGRWQTGYNPVSRVLGKELTVLAWAIEDADPSTVPTAIANWQGLAPEERWWLYTMTAAATGNYLAGRGRGWRKALRYALTENPITARPPDHPVVPEFFRLVSGTVSTEETEPIGNIEAIDVSSASGDENGSSIDQPAAAERPARRRKMNA